MASRAKKHLEPITETQAAEECEKAYQREKEVRSKMKVLRGRMREAMGQEPLTDPAIQVNNGDPIKR